jgi:hypothetical protein
MRISVITIEECFGNRETDLVPSFDFLGIQDPTFRLLRMQCQGDLLANPNKGVYNTRNIHIDKCREALKIARSERVDLFITPEYSIPIDLIDEIIRNPNLQPLPKKLWCLCCEGIDWETFQYRINQWSDYAEVGKKTLEDAYIKQFAGFMLYVFKSKQADKLCVVPQLKLQPMREDIFVCEGDGLTRGNYVILFGKDSPNQLVSIICADSYHQSIKDSSIFFPGGNERKLIVLHPQLNPAPRNGEIASLRENIFSQSWGNSTVYVTANWAAGSNINPERQRGVKHVIHTPWSSIYRRYFSYSGEKWIEKLRKIRNENLNHGLGFGYEPYKKYKVWFAHKNEHLQLLVIRKPFGGGPAITMPDGTVQAVKIYVPNQRNDGWIETTLTFQTDLPQSLMVEATGDFEYPINVSVEERDKFFGYCLGHFEEGELKLFEKSYKKEKSSRISYHIDDDCEPLRIRQAERVANLIRILKSPKTLPSQLRRMEGKYRLQLAKTTPFNLIPKSGNEKSGALVAYVEREIEMKETAQRILREIPYLGPWLEESICIFSTRAVTGEIVHYPDYSDEFTEPDRVVKGIDFSHGGVTIEQPFE